MTRLPESALHRIWERNDLLTGDLRTTDGRRVVILRAGTSNPDSGPDFLGAVLRIGATTFRGDVEIHTSPSQWHLHGHDRDTRYNRVILHVTGCSGGSAAPPARTCSGRSLPHLVLPHPQHHPDVSFTARERTIEACAARIRQEHDPHPLLLRLGWARIRRRTGRCGQRLLQLAADHQGIPTPGHWEQLLYETLMESMGYASNSAAFLLLARTVPLHSLQHSNAHDTVRTMGILFGAAGLLPDPATLVDDDATVFARALHRHWRAWHAASLRSPAPEMSWVFFRLRPANFPTARIAVMAHLLPLLFSRHRLPALLRMVTERRGKAHHGIRIMRQALAFTPQGFWSSHLHFHDRTKPRGVGLGRDLVTVMLLNAFLPVALLHARVNGNRTVARRLREAAQHIPAPHEPRIIRDIRERTPNLSGRVGGVEQMGMLELTRRAQKGKGKKKAQKPPRPEMLSPA